MTTQSDTTQRWQRHPWADGKDSGSLLLDVAIIGAGVSGLYSGYRLTKAGAEFARKVGIFEASHRVGGRVNSLPVPGTGLIADIGAMRYLPSQLLINGLVKHFKLKPYVHHFPLHGYFVRGRDLIPPTTHSTAGTESASSPMKERRPIDKEVGPHFEVVDQKAYEWLEDEEIGLDPGHLVALGIAKAFAKFDVSPKFSEDQRFENLGSKTWFQQKVRSASQQRHSLTFKFFKPREWQAIKEHVHFEDQPLYRISFWDLVQSSLSNEAYKLIEEGLGYQTIIGTWNAAEAIPWFLADFSVEEYYSLPGGMSSLIKCLTNGFVDGVSAHTPNLTIHDLVQFGHVLRQINKVEAEDPAHIMYELVFDCHNGDVHETQRFNGAGTPRTIYAKQVILALPQGALTQIRFGGALRPDEVKRGNPDLRWKTLLGSVTAHPLVKMFVLFKTAWWTACREELCQPQFVNKLITEQQGSDFCTCKAFTDLPLRMLYYHGPGTSSKGSHAPGERTSNGMIMAYCDARHAAYWDSLNRLDVNRYCDSDLWDKLVAAKDDTAIAIVRRYGVSELFARRIQEQLLRYHGRYGDNASAALPEVVLYMNWAHPPYFGGWHSWNLVGAGDPTPLTVRESIRCPLKGEHIFVCGEAFSQDQGWIEGALRSAEAVLRQPPFGLVAPTWEGVREALQSDKYIDFNDYVDW